MDLTTGAAVALPIYFTGMPDHDHYPISGGTPSPSPCTCSPSWKL